MPRLRPRPLTVLRRPGGGVQVGLDVEGAFVLPGAPEDAAGVLSALSAGASADDLPTSPGGADDAWTAAFVSSLAGRGFLVARRPPSLEVWGDGMLADRVSALLREEDAAVRRRPSPAHDDVSPGLSGRLVVLCAPSAEPDRALTTALSRARQPHLVVRAEPERAVVGPLVRPGRSACVRCIDLARRDVDPDWPGLLAQLCRQRSRPDPVLATWAAATAVAQVRAWSGGFCGEPPGTTLELDAVGGHLGVRRWPLHPECGCADRADRRGGHVR